MTPDIAEHARRLGITAAEIERLTADAFEELLRRLRQGQDPQSAISAIVGDFDERYREVLAASFSATLGRFVGPDELRAYPVGDMALSQRLYKHAAETTTTVREIVRRHAAGYHDARALTLQIYEGYGFKGGKDPLQWPARSPKWPKYMREAITADPASFAEFQAIARQAAGRIKTPALRAAYSEALDALENGKGFEHLSKKLHVAFEERMRYHANRIAQTELHRAWAGQQAEEIMADETIEVVKFEMSSSHPRTDICDLYAHQDAYGLGPGLYPKDQAPVPPLHPFCRCMLVSRRLISAKGAKFKPEAHRSYLRQVMREGGVSEAAKVVGSRAKLAVALTQSPVEAVFNIHRPVPYRLGRVGDGVARMRDMDKELTELPDVPRSMVHGLITKGQAMQDGEAFATAWTTPDSHAKHLVRRIARGDVVDADDYKRKTLETIATAQQLRVVTPADAAMRHTGKLVVSNDAWVVLLSPEGAIVTSYPHIAALESFEQRHLRLGDQIDEYTIGTHTRARLADVFR